MKKKVFYFTKILLLVGLWQISSQVNASDTITIISNDFNKIFGEQGDTLLKINYDLGQNKKIRIEKVFLVRQPQGEEQEEVSVKLKLKKFKEVVEADGFSKSIMVDLSEQRRLEKGKYTAKIICTQSQKGKKLRQGTGIRFHKRLLTPFGHQEVNDILKTQDQTIGKATKILAPLLTVAGLVGLTGAGYHYGEANVAANRRQEQKHQEHIKKTNQFLCFSAAIYILDFGWLTSRNRKQKKIRNHY